MTRSSFRRLWLITLACMLGAVWYAHGQYETSLKKVTLTQKSVDRLTAERRSGSQLTASLADLDSRTIDENLTTRLELLRYLGLEESNLKVSFGNPNTRQFGKNGLTVRTVLISGVLPYEEALNQLDYFYNTKKVSIKMVNLAAVGVTNFSDTVNFSLTGEIYALSK